MLAKAAGSVGFKGSLHEFANLASVSLTEKRWICLFCLICAAKQSESSGDLI